MDDTDDQEEDASLEKMVDSFSKATTLHGDEHGNTKDVNEPFECSSKLSEGDGKMIDSDTHHSVSPDTQYVGVNDCRRLLCGCGSHSYPGNSERLLMRSIPFFYVPDEMYKRYRI